MAGYLGGHAMRLSLRLTALGLALASSAAVFAEPWIGPGNDRVRHDIQMLSDAGLLTGPALSWPIGWSHVARELAQVDAAGLAPGLQAAVARLRALAQREMSAGDIGLGVELAGAVDPTPLRTFADTPREEGEATLAADWLGERFAWKLSATVVADPDDDQTFRPDGSYVAMSVGNWMLSAGYLDRWWGPGWEGSLILSSNARPVPAIAIDRNEPTPFETKWLSWLGPWRLSTFMGQYESDRDYENPLMWGLRVEFRPHPSLQIGVSRTAQWCGDGRPCGLDTFWDLLVGNDNDQDLAEQPGNQLGGFDVRWSWPGGRVPLAFYAQGIGEDEAGFMPSKYLGLFGAETWGEAWGSTWRAHVEYADTACDFLASPPEFGCAYTSLIYSDGYRFRGRSQGHAMDADGESIGFGGMIMDSAGQQWRALFRNVKLNRAGTAPLHSLSDGPARVRDVEVAHRRAFEWGSVEAGVGYADVAADAGVEVQFEDGARGFVKWRHDWR